MIKRMIKQARQADQLSEVSLQIWNLALCLIGSP
jgi:hypothetical protein